MEFFETVEKRTSVRNYLPKEVEKAKLDRMLHAANLAPSAGNLQSYRMLVVKGRKKRHEIMLACRGQEFVSQAPLLVAFIVDRERPEDKYGKRGSELLCVEDVSIAAAYFQLAATALGLGTVWVAGFDTEKISKLLKCGKHEEPIAVIPVGYPAEEMEGHERRKLNEISGEL